MLRFGEKEIAKETFSTAKGNAKIYDVNVSSGKWSNLRQPNNFFFKLYSFIITKYLSS